MRILFFLLFAVSLNAQIDVSGFVAEKQIVEEWEGLILFNNLRFNTMSVNASDLRKTLKEKGIETFRATYESQRNVEVLRAEDFRKAYPPSDVNGLIAQIKAYVQDELSEIIQEIANINEPQEVAIENFGMKDGNWFIEITGGYTAEITPEQILQMINKQ